MRSTDPGRPGRLRLPGGSLPALLALALLGAGCGPPFTHMPEIWEPIPERAYTAGGQTDRAAALALMERLALAARHLGYEVAPYQPERGRFGVPLRFAMDGERYRAAVELVWLRGELYLSITPIGARVGRRRLIRDGYYYETPSLLRLEMEDLRDSFRVASDPRWPSSARARAPMP